MTKFYRVDGETIPVNFKCQLIGFGCAVSPEKRDCIKCPCCAAEMEASDFLKIIGKVEA